MTEATMDHANDVLPRAQYLALISALRERESEKRERLEALEADERATYFDAEALASTLDAMPGPEVRKFIAARVEVTLTGKGRGRGKVEHDDLVQVTPKP